MIKREGEREREREKKQRGRERELGNVEREQGRLVTGMNERERGESGVYRRTRNDVETRKHVYCGEVGERDSGWREREREIDR